MSALAVAGAVNTAVQLNSRNKQLEAAAEDFGRKEAGISFNKERQQEAIVEGILATSDTEVRQKEQIALQLKKSTAESEVLAAVSGTTGKSVEQTDQELGRGAAKATASIAEQSLMEIDQLAQNFTDTALGADFATGQFKANSPNKFLDALSIFQSVQSGITQKREFASQPAQIG